MQGIIGMAAELGVASVPFFVFLVLLLLCSWPAPSSCQSLIGADDEQGGLYLVPIYHAPMLNDVVRNDAYYRALQKVITPSSVVVDLGAGSGLLSLMSAKLGAKKVFAVERKGFCESVTREIINLNNFTETIELLCEDAKFITAANLTTPDGEKPTILVSETLDSYIIGEGFLAMLYDWNSRVVVPPDALVIPHHATLYMQLAQTTYLLNETATVFGFDFTPVDKHRPRSEVIVGHIHHSTHKNLSSHFPLFDFNFAGGAKEKDFFHYQYVEVPITHDGHLSSAVFSFDLSLDREGEIKLNTFDNSSTHWKPMTYIFAWNKFVRKGDTVRLQVGQLPERIVIVDADDMRLIRFNNVGATKIDIYSSKEGETACSVEDEYYALSFFGGGAGDVEYNLWMGRVGQIFIFHFVDSGDVKSFVVPAPQEAAGQPLELLVYDISPPSSKANKKTTVAGGKRQS